mmetsp:Transcript_27381/g.78899  ORF Transcript_27381/g.78899 Transcript_27381/m.78899 type:complete len:288 (-) Transcript_27381:442-1305(-)
MQSSQMCRHPWMPPIRSCKPCLLPSVMLSLRWTRPKLAQLRCSAQLTACKRSWTRSLQSSAAWLVPWRVKKRHWRRGRRQQRRTSLRRWRGRSRSRTAWRKPISRSNAWQRSGSASRARRPRQRSARRNSERCSWMPSRSAARTMRKGSSCSRITTSFASCWITSRRLRPGRSGSLRSWGSPTPKTSPSCSSFKRSRRRLPNRRPSCPRRGRPRRSRHPRARGRRQRQAFRLRIPRMPRRARQKWRQRQTFLGMRRCRIPRHCGTRGQRGKRSRLHPSHVGLCDRIQ